MRIYYTCTRLSHVPRGAGPASPPLLHQHDLREREGSPLADLRRDFLSCELCTSHCWKLSSSLFRVNACLPDIQAG